MTMIVEYDLDFQAFVAIPLSGPTVFLRSNSYESALEEAKMIIEYRLDPHQD